MRYTVEVMGQVNGKEWSAKWSFTTLCAGEIHHELAGKLLRTLNDHRRRAGLQAISLDAERSKACTAHARYLEANASADPMLDWNEEKPSLPGYTEAGAAIARRSSIQGGGGPVEAVTGLVDSLISRPQILDPNLHALGLGYAPYMQGGWLWVMELQHRRRRPPRSRNFSIPRRIRRKCRCSTRPTKCPVRFRRKPRARRPATPSRRSSLSACR